MPVAERREASLASDPKEDSPGALSPLRNRDRLGARAAELEHLADHDHERHALVRARLDVGRAVGLPDLLGHRDRLGESCDDTNKAGEGDGSEGDASPRADRVVNCQHCAVGERTACPPA